MTDTSDVIYGQKQAGKQAIVTKKNLTQVLSVVQVGVAKFPIIQKYTVRAQENSHTPYHTCELPKN